MALRFVEIVQWAHVFVDAIVHLHQCALDLPVTFVKCAICVPLVAFVGRRREDVASFVIVVLMNVTPVNDSR